MSSGASSIAFSYSVTAIRSALCIFAGTNKHSFPEPECWRSTRPQVPTPGQRRQGVRVLGETTIRLTWEKGSRLTVASRNCAAANPSCSLNVREGLADYSGPLAGLAGLTSGRFGHSPQSLFTLLKQDSRAKNASGAVCGPATSAGVVNPNGYRITEFIFRFTETPLDIDGEIVCLVTWTAPVNKVWVFQTPPGRLIASEGRATARRPPPAEPGRTGSLQSDIPQVS